MNRSFAPADPDAPKFEPPLPDQPPETKFEAVSGDWHVLATSFSVAGTVREISVWEAGSLRRISTLPLPPGIQYVVCRLNTTGTIVAAALTNADNKDAGAICWQSATGRELFKIPDASRVIVSKDGNTLLTFSERIPSISLDDVEYRLSAWDVHTARKRFTIDLACRGFYLDRDAPMISPDDRIIAAPTGRGPVDPFGNLARRLGMRWPYRELSTGETMTLFDLASGREIGRVAGEFQWSRWSPDGTLLATLDDGRHVVRVWDIPPRKPLSWFALAAGVLALPPAWLARRRVRRLRSPAHL
jgi:hypothetical protein